MITYELLKAKEVKQLRNYNDLRCNFFLILDSEETKLKTSLAKCVFTFVSSLMLHGEDRPNTTPIGQRPLSFALTRTSFTDLPFLHEIRGGCLNIFRSEGRFCIRCHLFIFIFFNKRQHSFARFLFILQSRHSLAEIDFR